MKSLLAIFAVLFGLCPLVPSATQIGTSALGPSTTGAGNSHSPVFSADGRTIAFVSHANNLVTNDDFGAHLDLFVHHLGSSNTVLVSISTNGIGGANDNVTLYTLSSNALVVAFETAANNLASGDTNQIVDIYVRDLAAGSTRLVSVNSSGSGSGNGPSTNPLISEDGRYVVFESVASNLVTNDFNGTNDIFVHDRVTGVTELVSVNADGTASAAGWSHSPSASANGLTIAFVSHATNLVSGVTNTLGEIYVRSLSQRSNQWAVASHLRTTRMNGGPYVASEPALSTDGRFVAFKTLGQAVRFDLHRSTNAVLLEFSEPGGSVTGFQFIDNPRLAPWRTASPLAFSRNGRYLSYSTPTPNVFQMGLMRVDFEMLSTNLSFGQSAFEGAAGQVNYYYLTNVVPVSQVVVTNSTLLEPGSGSGYSSSWTNMPWVGISENGERICFKANVTGLVAGVTNRVFRIYSVEPATQVVSLISTNRNGGNGPELEDVVPALSADGSLIAWDTPDDNLVSGDLNRVWDVFARNLNNDEIQLVSAVDKNRLAVSGSVLGRIDPAASALSANGRYIAMLSLDGVLVPDDTNSWRDLFVRDLETGETIEVSRSIVPFGPAGVTNFPGSNSIAGPVLSADGRFVAFSGETTFIYGLTNRVLYWRDLQAPTNRIVVEDDDLATQGLSRPALSSNGRFFAFHSSGVQDNYHPDNNNQSDVFVQLMAPQLHPLDCLPDPSVSAPYFISVAWNSNTSANGPSRNPAFSPDGGSIVFQSRASNLAEFPVSPQSVDQLYSRAIWTTNLTNDGCLGQIEALAYSPTRLVSYRTVASADPSGRSTESPLAAGGANPRFSGDSRFVAFESGAEIYRHDLLAKPVVVWGSAGGITVSNVAAITNDLVCTSCGNPSVNEDGRMVAYEVRPPAGGTTSIEVKDLATGQTEGISVGASGRGNGNSSTPIMSRDSRYVVFVSKASDLILDDANRVSDIFVRDRLAGVTHCVSRNWRGIGTGDGVSSSPVMAANGRTVAFQSFAGDLVPGDYNDTRDVFVLKLAGADSDNDQLDDDWEMAYFSTLSRDGSGDFDGDGVYDRDEFRAGTDPTNEASVLRVLTLTSTLNSVTGPRNTVVYWSAVPGRLYRLQYKETIDAAWIQVGGNLIASSTTASALHATSTASEQGYYRVVLAQ